MNNKWLTTAVIAACLLTITSNLLVVSRRPAAVEFMSTDCQYFIRVTEVWDLDDTAETEQFLMGPYYSHKLLDSEVASIKQHPTNADSVSVEIIEDCK